MVRHLREKGLQAEAFETRYGEEAEETEIAEVAKDAGAAQASVQAAP
jgi:hypothetical protein